MGYNRDIVIISPQEKFVNCRSVKITMSDKIIIHGLRVFAYHGVLAEEKQKGQNFFLDIVLQADLSLPCLSDRVEHTVNYDEVCQCAVRAMTEESYDLIERAAQAVCDAILAQFHDVTEIELTLRKPEAPVQAAIDYAAVCIRRGRGTH